MLASPRYGERWGRHWLDVVRYADTGGFETDVYFANAWRYRDYVIDSFNQDRPYDQFVREQVAADEIWPGDFDLEGSYLLPESKKEYLNKLLGTGLYTLGAFPVEITFYGDQYRAEWQAESVDATGAAFLGLTLGCARCHDHNPIPQRDYYRMFARRRIDARPGDGFELAVGRDGPDAVVSPIGNVDQAIGPQLRVCRGE